MSAEVFVPKILDMSSRFWWPGSRPDSDALDGAMREQGDDNFCWEKLIWFSPSMNFLK